MTRITSLSIQGLPGMGFDDSPESDSSANAIAVYIHIPYCRTLCSYCDFNRVQTTAFVPEEYVNAVCEEIRRFEGPRLLKSIFFGGGTPSLLTADGLAQVMRALHERFQLLEPEVSMEVNPDDVWPESVTRWKETGVNRISLGIQSFDERVLRYLGRRHTARAAWKACEIVAGIMPNWGMDLIFGAHPTGAWETTLSTCAQLHPKHVSAYGLTYEPGTVLGVRAHEAIGETQWLNLYHAVEEHLARAGYDHYEISNYALPDFYCRHNLVYWHNEQYAGFGAGAYSFLNQQRTMNETDVRRYIQQPGSNRECIPLSVREECLETVIQHLRLRTGLMKSYYFRRFGRTVEEDFGPALTTLSNNGLIGMDDTYLCPTTKGFDLNNEIGLMLVGE